MDAIRRLEVELPEDLADYVRSKVESGRYANESQVIVAALALLDPSPGVAEEAWLRATIPARLKALDDGRTQTKTIDEARRSLAARRTKRDEAA